MYFVEAGITKTFPFGYTNVDISKWVVRSIDICDAGCNTYCGFLFIYFYFHIHYLFILFIYFSCMAATPIPACATALPSCSTLLDALKICLVTLRLCLRRLPSEYTGLWGFTLLCDFELLTFKNCRHLHHFARSLMTWKNKKMTRKFRNVLLAVGIVTLIFPDGWVSFILGTEIGLMWALDETNNTHDDGLELVDRHSARPPAFHHQANVP